MIRSIGKLTLAFAVAALAFAPASLSAQRAYGYGNVASGTEGFSLGAHILGSAVSFSGDDDAGSGIGLSVGYGFSPSTSIFVNADAADIDGITFANVDLGVRYTFGSDTDEWRPYAGAALTGMSLSADVRGETTSINGGALSVLGGVQYFFSPSVAADVGVVLGSGRFTEARVGGKLAGTGSLDATASRVMVGLKWYPGR
jgi:hypothetical protein